MAICLFFFLSSLQYFFILSWLGALLAPGSVMNVSVGGIDFQNLETSWYCAEERWRGINILVNHTDEAIRHQSGMSLACILIA